MKKSEGLAPRQMEVALLLAIGRTNAEIANELKISVKTVDSHRAAVLDRLGLRNNVELARHALRVGWVTLEVKSEAAQSQSPVAETGWEAL